jgi:hypothetical protein
MSRASRVLLDLDPLRESRDFRLLFAGQLVSMLGSQLTMVAIPFQVYALTGSTLQVGAVSLAQLVPHVAGALAGGALGDAVDRRRILLVTSTVLSLTSVALAANSAVAHPSLAAIYLVSAAAAGLAGMVSTACNAAVPSLVGSHRLVAAYASMQVVDRFGMVVGPAVSGLLIEAVHLRAVYALDGVSYLVAAAAALGMSAIPPAETAETAEPARHPGLGAVVEGIRFIRRRPALQGAYLIDVNATVFGLPRALFPALARSAFPGGASTLGCLYAAPAAGALLGALGTGWLERVRRRGRAVVVAVCVWGAAIAAFGLVHLLWLALGLLAVAGWADVTSAVLRNTILQTSVPEAFRSRIASVQMAVVEGGPRLGDLEAGGVAAAMSPQFSIVSGGLACVAGALLVATLLPGFRDA